MRREKIERLTSKEILQKLFEMYKGSTQEIMERIEREIALLDKEINGESAFI